MDCEAVVLPLIVFGHPGKTSDVQPPLSQILWKPPASIHLHHGIQNLLTPVRQHPLLFCEVTVTLHGLRRANTNHHTCATCLEGA